jgi:hypothetical protein
MSLWEPITPLVRVRSYLPRVTHDGVFVWFKLCYRRTLYNPYTRNFPYNTQYLSVAYVERTKDNKNGVSP